MTPAGIPRILVGGTHSGCGKTTVACGLMAALTARGLRVQPFKVGPDFIDPGHHTAICTRPSRNLDPYMMGEGEVRRIFADACRGADVAIIEGVMGLFDGCEGTNCSSSAHVARILESPVLLVVDARGASRSAGAMVRGFVDFDPRIRVAAVVINRVGSFRHRAMIEGALPVPAAGWIPWDRDQSVKSRHLGLEMAHETSGMGRFGELVSKHGDLDRILEIAGSAPPLDGPVAASEAISPSVRIGVARDPAFCFYYQENLDRLRRRGAELVFFSPMTDALPEVDAVYLGGGYPELHARALSGNRCRTDLARAADDGLPVFGECGGLVYLARSIATPEGEYAMAGILPARGEQMDRFEALGYVRAETVASTPLFPAGMAFRGHEFHYSRVDCDPDARFSVCCRRGTGIDGGRDGLTEHAVVAGYTHACFTDELANSIIAAAARHRRR
ncbi:MAG: cobyrinate a,c-diamide synthase [Methanomicrobiales archaeon]